MALEPSENREVRILYGFFTAAKEEIQRVGHLG